MHFFPGNKLRPWCTCSRLKWLRWRCFGLFLGSLKVENSSRDIVRSIHPWQFAWRSVWSWSGERWSSLRRDYSSFVGAPQEDHRSSSLTWGTARTYWYSQYASLSIWCSTQYSSCSTLDMPPAPCSSQWFKPSPRSSGGFQLQIGLSIEHMCPGSIDQLFRFGFRGWNLSDTARQFCCSTPLLAWSGPWWIGRG